MGDEFQVADNVERTSNDTYWTQQRINENTYIIHFGPPSKEKKWNDTIFVEVWATRCGSEEPLPDHPVDLGSSYNDDPHKRLVREDIYMHNFKKENMNFSTIVSQAVNEAVCELENKQEDRESYEDDVLAAIEANKEVHEGIDYELGIER